MFWLFKKNISEWETISEWEFHYRCIYNNWKHSVFLYCNNMIAYPMYIINNKDIKDYESISNKWVFFTNYSDECWEIKLRKDRETWRILYSCLWEKYLDILKEAFWKHKEDARDFIYSFYVERRGAKEQREADRVNRIINKITR